MGRITQEIHRCIPILEKDGLLIYPTETGWVVGCDATSHEAVSKVYGFSNIPNGEPLTCLVSGQAMLERHVASLPEPAYDILDFSEKPITLVLDTPKGIAKSLIHQNTAAFRVAKTKFCQYLINKYRKPLVAHDIGILNQPVQKKIGAIPVEISQSVDYVVNLQPEKENTSLSSIIKLGNDGTVKVIRE